MTFLFWNFNIEAGSKRILKKGPDPAVLLARAAAALSVDVLALAECPIPEGVLLSALRAEDPRYELPANPHPRIKFFTRFPKGAFKPIVGDDRLALRRLNVAGAEDILVAAAHFADSRNNPDEKDRAHLLEVSLLALRRAERKFNPPRTILFGDLNMNPTDWGMISPGHLGAMMTKQLARTHSRPDDGGTLRSSRFYNPMWALWGQSESPGTFYWGQSRATNVYWHCVDAVLVRPELCDSFDDKALRILTELPGSDGQPVPLQHFADTHWRGHYSDHLPILFRLNL